MTRKQFFIQIALMAGFVALVIFITMWWLKIYTNHGQQLELPEYVEWNIKDAKADAEKNSFDIVVNDSAHIVGKAGGMIIDQNPNAGAMVKENRKIYLTLNPSGYRKIMIPDLIRRTRRQAEPTLRSLGFEIGDVTYKPDIAKDAVLELRHKGEMLQPGDELMKTSKIDLVLGDGSGRYHGNETNSAEDEIEL